MEVLKVDFGLLRGIIRDKSNKSKDTIDSAICLNQYLNLEMNSVEEIRKMKQDESANFIMSLQNWFLRRNYSSTKVSVCIGDIFYADLGINYKVNKNIKTFVKVNNLFDKLYSEQSGSSAVEPTRWYTREGRNFLVGMEYNF